MVRRKGLQEMQKHDDLPMKAALTDTLPPTPKAMELLRVLVEWADTYDCAPSYKELMGELEITSTCTIKRLVDQLAERGWIRRLPCRARAIRVLRRPPMPDFSTPTFVMSAELAERSGQ